MFEKKMMKISQWHPTTWPFLKKLMKNEPVASHHLAKLMKNEPVTPTDRVCKL